MKNIVKPATTWLTTDSDTELINDVDVILLGVGNNPNIYKTPNPPLADIQTASDNFAAALAAKASGGQADTSKKNNLRLILVGLMRQLANYVATACLGDMTNLLLSGFPTQKPSRQPIGPLPAPIGLVVKHGNHGQLVAKANPVFGAAIYNWRCTPATAGAAPIVEQDTAANHAFSNLTSGVNYTIDVNASGTAGVSDWSNPASMIAD